MSERIDSREYFEQIIVAKMWKDEEFKKQVLANPREAIAKVLAEREPDAKLPDVDIKVFEESAEQIYIVSPAEIEDPKTEITEEDKKSLGRKSMEHIIASRAAADSAYKAKLQSDPKGTLQAALQELDRSLSLPDNLKVTLLEETGKEAFLVVPPDPTQLADAELTEEQLEAVAGGVVLIAVAVVGVVAVAAAATAAAAVNVAAAVNITEAVNVHHVATAVKGADESPW